MRHIKLAVIPILAMLLLACSSKPPSCDDASTLMVLQNIISQKLNERVTDKSKLNELKGKDLINFNNIRNNGFNEKEQKFSCVADATIAVSIGSDSEPMKQLTEVVKVANALKDGRSLNVMEEIQLRMVGEKIGLENLIEVTGVSVENFKISAPITYTSTYSTNSNKDKEQYVESVGVMPLANAMRVIVNLYTPSIKKDQSQVPPTEGGAGSTKKMLGDVEDKNQNAEPNTPEDFKNKKSSKNWQDKNGFMHYADGSASNGPVD